VPAISCPALKSVALIDPSRILLDVTAPPARSDPETPLGLMCLEPMLFFGRITAA
jgi:hypothetical protein